MKVILKDDQEVEILIENALRKILPELLAQFQPQPREAREDWVTTKEAMSILNIRSNTTMQALRNNRDQNGIIISQPGRKILYYRPSLYAYINQQVD